MIADSITDGAMGLSTNIIKLYVLDELAIIKDCEPAHKCKITGECSVMDDINRILKDIRGCDLLILSIPLEGTEMSKSMKILLNRLTSLID